MNVLNSFRHITEKDLRESFSLYFLNTSNYDYCRINRIADVKLLNFFRSESQSLRSVWYQSNSIYNRSPFDTSSYPFVNYHNVPGSLNYETSGTYINTEGIVKKTFKMILSPKTSKGAWYIIRKFMDVAKSLSYSSNPGLTNKVIFNTKTLYSFKIFVNYHYYATKSLGSLSFYLASRPSMFVLDRSQFYLASKKTANTKLKFWLDDFYLGGKDTHSFSSSTMAACSLSLRYEITNFN